jgi:uncharacterized alkaline shock family protein YloU
VAQTLSTPLGRIAIASEAVAQIVGRTAAECYGVVGMASRPGLGGGRVGRLLSRDRATQGIGVARDGDGLRIELYVVVEYGLNLAEVGASVRSRVAYEVERLTGLRVGSVEVHIQDVRRSD